MEHESSTANPSEEQSIHPKRRTVVVRDMCYIALFAAIIAVCAYIAIPVGPISVSLQTLAVCLAAGLLGLKRGILTILVYIMLGVCGIPVRNFYALIAGPSAGYVVGFFLTALLVGITTDNLHKIGDRAKNKTAGQIAQLVLLAIAMAIGILVCYLFGTLWYAASALGGITAENLYKGATVCVIPFLLPDLVKIIVAAILVNRLKRFVK